MPLVAHNAIICCLLTRVATSSTCPPIKLTPFVNTWVVKHLRCIAWVAPILHVRNLVCNLRCRKSHKNLWSCTSAASPLKVMRSPPTLLGNTKWKVPFLLQRHPISAPQLPRSKATWNALPPWTAWCAAMWVLAKQKWLFVPPSRQFKTASK